MKKLWKWLFGTRNQQCNIHDISKNEVAGCDHSHGFYFDEKGIITCARCYPPKIKQTER